MKETESPKCRNEDQSEIAGNCRDAVYKACRHERIEVLGAWYVLVDDVEDALMRSRCHLHDCSVRKTAPTKGPHV